MDKYEFVTRARERLLAEYDPELESTWQIKGEDMNADLGGRHECPILGYVRGKYKNVVEHALSVPRFFNWGYGGDVTQIEVKDV